MMERTQAEEAEQEQRSKLLRSRNKKEDDPDREKKKKDAKMKQQALQEAEQQKQADETALEASRRKPRSANAVRANKIMAYYRFPASPGRQPGLSLNLPLTSRSYFSLRLQYSRAITRVLLEYAE